MPVATPSGTVIANLSGAATYAVMGGGGKIVVDGATLKTSGTFSVGTLSFYLTGIAADGTPGIVPKFTVHVT